MALFKKTPIKARLPQDAQTKSLAVLLTFADRDVEPHLDAIRQAASYIPRYWCVSEDERAIVKRLFHEGGVKIVGSSVFFDLPLTGSDETTSALAEILKEKARGWEGAKFMLGEGVGKECVLAFGGFREEVEREVREMLDNQPQAGQSTSASCGM